MNPLDILKEKLKEKPILQEREPVNILIKGKKEEEGEFEPLKRPIIVDETSKGFNREELLRRMAESGKLKVVVKETLKEKEIVIHKKEIAIYKDDDKKKEFIKSLPSNIFVLLKSKGGVNYSGFIKAVVLTQDEELSTNPDILMALYDNGLIKEQ